MRKYFEPIFITMNFMIFIILFVVLMVEGTTNKSVIENDTIPSKYIETFKYKGHTMIYIQNKGISHDPECQYCYDKFD